MISLTKTKDSRPVARIKGGDLDGSTVYITDIDPRKEVIETKTEDPYQTIGGAEFFSRSTVPLTRKQQMILSNAMKQGYLGDSKDEKKLRSKFNRGMNELKYCSKHVHLKLGEDATMVPIPRKGEHQCISAGGVAGAGKSTIIAQFVKEYKKMKPDADIFLFSQKPEDPAMDTIKGLNRVIIDNSLVDDPMELADFPNDSITIFDDIDVLPKKQLLAVMLIRDQLVNMIRSRGGIVLSCVHNFLQYKITRNMLLESSDYIVFPRTGAVKNIIDMLKSQMGLSKDDIDKILKLPTRWAWIKKSAPQIVIYQGGCYIIGKNEDFFKKPSEIDHLEEGKEESKEEKKTKVAKTVRKKAK
jgi:hypothetical protein